MILERAILQQTLIGRDGDTITRVCPRPDHVRDTAKRMQRWRDAGEGCQLCRAENAVAVRGGMAVCGVCRANMAQRMAGFEHGLKVQPIRPSQRAADTGLSGLAIVFDSLSVDLGGFRERIDARAVDRTLAEGSEVVQLVDHDSSKPIGRLSAGTLRMRKTSRGLANSIPDPPQTTVGRDVIINIERRDIKGQSFGFYVMEDGDEWDVQGDTVVRTISDMRFIELSAVTFPAYPATTIELGDEIGMRERALAQAKERTRLAR